MEIYRVALFGHRQYHNPSADRRLQMLLSSILREHTFVEFYIGRNGDFDLSAAAAIKTLQTSFGQEGSALILSLPWLSTRAVRWLPYGMPKSVGSLSSISHTLRPKQHKTAPAQMGTCGFFMFRYSGMVIRPAARNTSATFVHPTLFGCPP